MSADLALDLLPTNYVSSSRFLRLGQESLRYRNFEWGLAAVRITQGNINCWRILITIIGSPWYRLLGTKTIVSSATVNKIVNLILNKTA